MIIDCLNNSAKYECLNENLSIIFSLLKSDKVNQLMMGKNLIDENRLFAVKDEYLTKSYNSDCWEMHKKYVDLQFVVEGKERIGYSSNNRVNELKPYNEKDDISWHSGEGDFLTVSQGFFVILFPGEIHMPAIAVCKQERVKKIVFKILLEDEKI